MNLFVNLISCDWTKIFILYPATTGHPSGQNRRKSSLNGVRFRQYGTVF